MINTFAKMTIVFAMLTLIPTVCFSQEDSQGQPGASGQNPVYNSNGLTLEMPMPNADGQSSNSSNPVNLRVPPPADSTQTYTCLTTAGTVTQSYPCAGASIDPNAIQNQGADAPTLSNTDSSSNASIKEPSSTPSQTQANPPPPREKPGADCDPNTTTFQNGQCVGKLGTPSQNGQQPTCGTTQQWNPNTKHCDDVANNGNDTTTTNTNTSADNACSEAHDSAVSACVSPIGATANSVGSNSALLQLAGSAAGIATGVADAQRMGTPAGMTTPCTTDEMVSAGMGSAYAAFTALCESARLTCIDACSGGTTDDKKFKNDCNSYAKYTAAGVQGGTQFSSAFVQSKLCSEQAQANAQILQSTNDCTNPANANTAVCQAYYAGNPCASPSTTPACICSQNPNDPVCAAYRGQMPNTTGLNAGMPGMGNGANSAAAAGLGNGPGLGLPDNGNLVQLDAS